MHNGVSHTAGPSQANVDAWRKESRSSGENWERSAWDAYRGIPEVRNAVDWLAKSASRVRLYAAWEPTDGTDPQPIEDTPQNRVLLQPMRELFGGSLKQASIQRQWYRYRLVAGKSLIAAVRPTSDERARYRIRDEWLWKIQSAREITDGNRIGDLTLTWKTYSGSISRTLETRAGSLHIPDDVVIMLSRVEDPDQPDRTLSTVQSVMGAAETLVNVSDSINATSLSRLSMSGIIAYTPDMTIPGQSPIDPDEDPVIAGMMTQIAANTENRRSAAAAAPHLWRSALSATEAPISNQLAHIDTSSRYDERTLDIVDWQTRRIAIGMSTPVEITNGETDQNHWNALYTGQDGVRVVIGPDMAELAMLVDDTWQDIRLEQLGVPDNIRRKVTVWWDGSSLTQDPDRSATALEARRIDPTIITDGEVRKAIGLPSTKPQSRETTTSVVVSPRSQSSRTNGLIPGIPSTNGMPTVRNPGFPAPPSSVGGGRG